MATGFTKAVKRAAKLRLALAGPAGSGKTYTALMLATALADGQPVAVVDTERGSASKYADQFDFDVLELDSFHPAKYVEAIQAAAEAGYAVVVLDSLSHAWNGKGGILEIVQRKGNSFQAWGEVKPIENALIESITGARLHVIATMRSKTEYAVEQNERGKAAPKKIGTAPVQRDGMEYEFDVFGELDIENTLTINKSRCPALSGAVIAKPGATVAKTLAAWLAGAPAPTPTPEPARSAPVVSADPGPDARQVMSQQTSNPAMAKAKKPENAAFAALRRRALNAGILSQEDWEAVCVQYASVTDPDKMTKEGKQALVRYVAEVEAAKAATLAKVQPAAEPDVTFEEVPADEGTDLANTTWPSVGA